MPDPGWCEVFLSSSILWRAKKTASALVLPEPRSPQAPSYRAISRSGRNSGALGMSRFVRNSMVNDGSRDRGDIHRDVAAVRAADLGLLWKQVCR